MNPRLKIIEEFLKIDNECDVILIKLEDNKFTYTCLDLGNKKEDVKEVAKGEIILPVASLIYLFSLGVELQSDIAGSADIYNRGNGQQILASILSFPDCNYEIVYHSDIDRGNFSNELSEKLRNSFKVI